MLVGGNVVEDAGRERQVDAPFRRRQTRASVECEARDASRSLGGEGPFDRVLVDAPCSGIGALRRNPEARWRLAEEDLRRLPAQQRAIAQRAQSLVAPGGRLIYATCTLLREENEEVVATLGGAGWEPMRVAEIWGTERALRVSEVTGTYLKLRPDRHDTDGFFATVLRRVR